MSRFQEPPLVMVLRPRHSAARRLQRAYQLLYEWAKAQQPADENKESDHASSGTVRSGLDPAPGAGSHD